MQLDNSYIKTRHFEIKSLRFQRSINTKKPIYQALTKIKTYN